MLPGSVVRPTDEAVITEDAEVIQANPGLLIPGVGPILLYDSFNDLNGDGVVNGLDVQSAVTRNTSRLLNTSAPAAASFAINAPAADSFANDLPAAASITSNSPAVASFAIRADSIDPQEQATVLRSSAAPESVSSQVSLAGSQEAHEKTDRASDSHVEGKQVETKAESLYESVDSVFEDLLDEDFETI